MAKDEETAFDTDTISKMLLKAKSSGNELNFAFGLAAKPADCGLMLHLRKPGMALHKSMKAMPGIKKACFGTVTVDGKLLLLKPTKPLKGIVKQLGRKLRDEGMVKFKPVLVGKDGKEIDEDTLPEADQADDTDAPAVTPVEDTALKARLLRANKAAQKLGSALPAGVPAQIQEAARLFKSGALGETSTALDAIEAALAGAARQGGGAKQGGSQDKLKASLIELLGRVKAMPQGASQAALLQQAQGVNMALKSGDADQAMAALREFAGAIKAAKETTAPTGDPQALWRDAKESVDQAISQLQSKLRGFNDPVMTRIAEFGLNGLSEGNQTALNKALFEFNGSEGPSRAKAAAALAAQALSYKGFMASNKLVDLCENNPFGVAVPIREKLGSALDDIARLAKAAS